MVLTISTGRKILLSLAVTAVFFLLLEGVLALAGIRPQLYSRDPYVGFSSRSRLFVETGGPGQPAEMVTADNKFSLFNRQRFRVDKGDAIRIFCVGGSTTFGRPYDDTTSFCGWLREMLPVADPSRRWDVINAGGVSYASYRVAILMEELVAYDPDIFIVYSGHNEFLERRTYPQIIATPKAVRGLGAVAAGTRTYTALAAVIRSVTGGRKRSESPPAVLDEEVTTLLDDAVGPSAYTRDDDFAEKTLQHFRFNLARMVDIAGSVGAETLLITPASNLRDSRPFKSEHRGDFDAPTLERFNALVNQAGKDRAEGRNSDAVAKIGEAAVIDPRHAELAFFQGRLLAGQARWSEARASFERARDEDVCPLRALGPTAPIVRDLAAERGVPVVDFESLVDEWSENGIPGSDLFLDHVHPTIEAHRRLAVAIVDELARQGLADPAPEWGEAAVAEVAQRVEGGLDASAHALALMKLSKVLGWAGKLQESYRLAAQAVELDPNDSRIRYNAGLTAHLIGRKAEAVTHYRRAVEIQPDADEPHGNLGVLLEEAGQLDEAVHHYRLAIRYARSPETATRNSGNLAHALMMKGYRDYSQGRLEDSLISLGEAAKIAPREPEILSRLGIAQLAAGQTGAAIASFDTAARIRPSDGALQNKLALALAFDGQLDRAAQTYRRALELDASVKETPGDLFRVLGSMGRDDLAGEIRERMGE